MRADPRRSKTGGASRSGRPEGRLLRTLELVIAMVDVVMTFLADVVVVIDADVVVVIFLPPTRTLLPRGNPASTSG